MKTENIFELFCLGCICVFLVLAFQMGEALRSNQMKRESLEGYRAVAIYETNAVGEVKIKRIDWKKP